MCFNFMCAVWNHAFNGRCQGEQDGRHRETAGPWCPNQRASEGRLAFRVGTHTNTDRPVSYTHLRAHET